ncbi:MAG: hypothetical protein JJ895_13590 [Balneolaceae bacterium]|nr:hypothetical protein [Balneolaceae bacterium]
MNNEPYFKITDSDKIRPFFMSIVSDSNHWMFISSNGGLTAGRKNSEFSLFPYYTDDKITEFADITGSKTIIQVVVDGKKQVWEPFSKHDEHRYNTSRNLYKSRWGNKVLFEEINHDLNLSFKYEWKSSNDFGFVRTSTVQNIADSDVTITILDGIQNILPASVNSDLQVRSSNLLDAYKRSEMVTETGLGIYALSAIPVDKAEPSEALKANVVWSTGLKNPTYLVSSLQLDAFRNGASVTAEDDIKGEKGAYFVCTELTLAAGTYESWNLVANVNQNHAGTIALNERLKSDPDELQHEVDQNVQVGTKKLKNLVAQSDGMQLSADELKDARHYSNVLFNIMRGGIFDHHYQIEKDDFAQYLDNASKPTFQRNQKLLSDLPEVFDQSVLLSTIDNSDDADLIRLVKEYLPLKFSRRHGDPSRPWNRFSINTHNEDGTKILDYEGNWRDIFQNWEALAHSYPKFLEGMIFKFLNATTFDGYNPYRVTKGGFDWETIEPDDPWSYIGYWGDHQIIYLLKFLELYEKHQPEAFPALMDEDVFVYANVPYRIKSYDDIAKNPKDTIDFDAEGDEAIRERVAEIGADGALLINKKNEIHRVSLLEKLLATTLAKVSNLIPEGGIWMNTQRPEWNDANNALVGNGVSMVTLYYLRRFLAHMQNVLASVTDDSVEVSVELLDCFNSIKKTLDTHKVVISGAVSDEQRKTITDALGKAASDYRDSIYNNGFSGELSNLDISAVREFVAVTNEYLEHSIRSNKRNDNLYHAYNIMSIEGDGISISYLDEMLEGQVAVLSSGYLTAEESLEVLEGLRQSTLYREDQASYILYPNKELPGFLQRNNVPESAVSSSKLLSKMVETGDTRIISKDVNGGYHFNGNFKNAGDLDKALTSLEDSEFADLVAKEREAILDTFEDVFNHKAFTGRSGTFYGYEGLGSIYWHMVSKLYLAAFEVCDQAEKAGSDEEVKAKLAEHFYEIGEGIGIHKSPEVYGAFPTDPYSHTPYHRGAQQPGMTGQVKEDILARIGELGIEVEDGVLSFNPVILRKSEFLTEPGTYQISNLNGNENEVVVPKNALAFSYCQVPVIYKIEEQDGIEAYLQNGASQSFNGLSLDKKTSAMIFGRTGEVTILKVSIKEHRLINS